MTMTKKTSAEQLIQEVIREFGPISFERFMELALYHPTYGYYQRGEPQRGRAGDYFTSLQVSSLFPAVFANAVIAMKEVLDTDQFALVEWGAGDGEFLAGLLQALADRNQLKGVRAWAVEASRPARERLKRKLSRFPKCEIISSLDDVELVGGFEGCFFSNEFFDAIPFQRLRFRNGEWKEIFIDVQNGGLVEIEKPTNFNSNYFKNQPIEDGQEIEWRPAMDRWIDQWGPMLTRGYVLTVDYGAPRAELLVPHRRQGTWRGYFEHALQTDALAHVGRQDLTAHVDFSQLVEAGRKHGWDPAFFSSQGIFLTHLGAPVWERALTSAGPNAQAQVTGALQQLLHPDAMGESFSVLLQSKEVEIPSAFQAIPNRIRRVV